MMMASSVAWAVDVHVTAGTNQMVDAYTGDPDIGSAHKVVQLNYTLDQSALGTDGVTWEVYKVDGGTETLIAKEENRTSDFSRTAMQWSVRNERLVVTEGSFNVASIAEEPQTAGDALNRNWASDETIVAAGNYKIVLKVVRDNVVLGEATKTITLSDVDVASAKHNPENTTAPTFTTVSIDGVPVSVTVTYSTLTFETVTVTMSEAVDLVVGAEAIVTIGGSEFGTFAVSGDGMTLTITPTNQNLFNYVPGEFTFDIAADTLQDAVGNMNNALSFTLTFAVDTGAVDANLAAAKAAETALTPTDYVEYSAVTTALAMAEGTDVEKIVKTAVINDAIAGLVLKLAAYNAALLAVNEADYTTASWTTYQLVVTANVVTVANTQAEVDAATLAITTAQGSLATATVPAAKPFDITNASLDRTSGIKATATVNRTNAPDNAGTEVVIFQLMRNGAEPVNIVALQKDITSSETLIAHFNVTGQEYTVKVFVFDQFTSDTTNAPTNLAVPQVL